MRSSYDRNSLTNSNIFNNNINSSRNFYGNSSKLENLQNLYFSLNPYSKSTSINANNQLNQLKRFQSEAEDNELDKKYGKPIINNYKRFHIKAEEIKKGKEKNLDKNTIYTNYTPEAKNNPNLAFYSIADLSMLHPLTYQKVKSSERYLTSGNLKYNTRLQMVDEKIKKLEEKNECLNVINNIFFDSLKDNITQSLKRKGFLRKHLKDIEYLKQINLEEYNNKVKYLMDLVEQGQIDFDNYNFEGESLNGMNNMVGRIEALKTEIGTMLTKNTMKHDINLNLLKQDVDNVKDELEKKLLEFSENNNKNYAILKEYLRREEEDRLAEKQKKKKEQYYNRNNYIQEMAEKFQIKGTKSDLNLEQTKIETEKKTEKEKESTEKTEEIEQSEVSSESNKNIDVIDKILLDSISLSLTSKGGIKEKSTKKSSKKNKTTKGNNTENIDNINDNNNVEENEIALTSSNNITNSKTKGSKKSKWKLLQESEESNLPSNKNINEIKEEDENNINNIITGSYKSKFNSNKPEIENKSKRSKGSKKFKLSKKSEEPFEKEESNKKEKTVSIKEESNKKEKTESKKEEFEDDKIEGTESSSATTSSFKLTIRSNKVDLHSIKENQEVFLSSDNSKTKDKDKKSKRSKRSKKSKKKNSINQSIKEKSQEEEDDN